MATVTEGQIGGEMLLGPAVLSKPHYHGNSEERIVQLARLEARPEVSHMSRAIKALQTGIFPAPRASAQTFRLSQPIDLLLERHPNIRDKLTQDPESHQGSESVARALLFGFTSILLMLNPVGTQRRP
ncbi:hypothetical protein MMC07_000862 [Pseudocyphellaria aurata]|nr:hypothetical protein [Pseudocyphellaria aurata]